MRNLNIALVSTVAPFVAGQSPLPRITIPAGTSEGIAAIMNSAFPDQVAELQNHGCWCAYAFQEETDGMGGVKPVDYLDDLCRRWFSTRRCTQLKDGDCRNDKDDSYSLIRDPWYSCSHSSNRGVCDVSTCAIDVHFKDLIEAYLDDLLTTQPSFSATPAAAGSCVRVFPLERPAAPHVMKSTFYCTGTSPELHRTDYYDDSFEASAGQITALSVTQDKVRAVAADDAVTIKFQMTPDANYDCDEWNIWHIDESGDIELIQTPANQTQVEFNSYVTHPWIVTKAPDTVFGDYMCGFVPSAGATTVTFTVNGEDCNVVSN